MSLGAQLTPLFSARVGLLDELVSVDEARSELRNTAARTGNRGSAAPTTVNAAPGESHRALLGVVAQIGQLERQLDELQRRGVGGSK